MIDRAWDRRASGVRSTTVTFGPMSDEEVDAYVATGEPLTVAGALTLDGRSAVFVDRIEGDPPTSSACHPGARDLLAAIDVRITDLWA